MPLALERRAGATVTPLDARRERRARSGATLFVGLVNNMPDAALRATERQFSRLLQAAAGAIDVRLRLYALPEVPRSAQARAAMAARYRDADEIFSDGVDALIVTGAEPVAADLVGEPYWRALTGLIDRADGGTHSTILSCLAAHAGVRHFDGVARRGLPAKCSGVFAFETTARHPLVAGLEAGVTVPHSRRNELDRAELARHGYRVLTADPSIGVDAFVGERRSLFVFLQGHPEYDADTLAREYRRDIDRFLRGAQEQAPVLPVNCFPPAVERACEAFLARARAARRPALMREFPATLASAGAEAPWRGAAIRFYANWLGLVAQRKAGARDNAPIAAVAGRG